MALHFDGPKIFTRAVMTAYAAAVS